MYVKQIHIQGKHVKSEQNINKLKYATWHFLNFGQNELKPIFR